LDKMKKLGEKGWKFTIDLGGRLVFMRERRSQEE